MVKKHVMYSAITFIVVLAGLMYLITDTPGEGVRAEIEGANEVGSVDRSSIENSGDKVEVNQEISNFEFEGFSVGKSHVGTFEEGEAYLYIENGEIVGLEALVQTTSVNTGIGGLDEHLISEDFFDSEKYPELYFESSEIENGEMVGVLKFRDISKEISFPVEVSGSEVSAEFFLDTTPFEMTNAKVNKEVRISFSFKV